MYIGTGNMKGFMYGLGFVGLALGLESSILGLWFDILRLRHFGLRVGV